jgi:8-oxo-dGTP pyrophosphatase MutT (NUDIX family)
MEQGHFLSPRRLAELRLDAGELERRLAGAAPGRRHSPAGATLRGDHDLNPDMFEPERPLTPAAVLVPLVERAEGPTVLLTRRTDHLRDHAGQIAFPGGRVDPEDSGPLDAALREAEEEVGLARAAVRTFGQLDVYVTRTGFEVTPVVGVVTPPFDLVLDPFEVAEAFEVPLAYFLAAGSRQRHSRILDGVERHYYVYAYEKYYIWGATAGMLSNLAEVLGLAD